MLLNNSNCLLFTDYWLNMWSQILMISVEKENLTYTNKIIHNDIRWNIYYSNEKE